jgi:hypothetical protein
VVAHLFVKPSVLIMLIALCVSANAFAQKTEISASVDRNKLYENDTLTLTVIANTEVELSFGGILNFGRNQIEAPSFKGLEDDWEVLDRQQNYNMSSVNGRSTSQITWRYILVPKRVGSLIIPAAEYGDGQSSPLTVEVLPGTAPKDANNPPVTFLEAEVNKPSAYVQEQITYTLRIYSLGQVSNGDMSAPTHPDAIVESMGDTKKYYRMAFNNRYEVHERTYLIFPQKSGVLTLASQSFAGTIVDPSSRRRMRARERSNEVSVDIKSPPAEYTGGTWLPAAALYLAESWDNESKEVFVGDSITRTTTLSALGLLGSALPPLPELAPKGFKTYPDKPQLNSIEHAEGVQSQRAETTAFVAISPGETTLPEIKIPWWDTVNNVERVAVLPARTIQVLPLASEPANSTAGSSTQTNQAYQAPAVVDTQPAPNAEQTGEESTDQEEILKASLNPATDNTTWYLLITLLCFGWALSVYLLLKRLAHVSANQQSKDKNNERDLESDSLFMAAIEAIKSDGVDPSQSICRWLAGKQTSVSSGAAYTLAELRNNHPELFDALRELEQANYAQTDTNVDAGSLEALRIELEGLLRSIHNQNKTTQAKHDKLALKPFYPN